MTSEQLADPVPLPHEHSSHSGLPVAHGVETQLPVAPRQPGDTLPNLGDMDTRCGGCRNVIDQESGGVVVAFGSSLWHVDCFRCAKCKDRVSADTNLLLLSDGSPICSKCSYSCYVCKQAITEEAIMTGDESYHAHCFTCRTCKQRIEELVFAKTSQGIYCMACHNERVARSRRHAEAKRQRAARKEREREEALRREDDARAMANNVPSHPSVHGGLSNSISSKSLAPPNAPSPRLTPALGSPNSPASHAAQSDASSPKVEALNNRPRDLGQARSVSPIGRIAEQMPLPASPSESQPPSRGPPSASGSPQGRRPVASPSNGAHSPVPEVSAPPSFGSSPSRNANAGLGVGPTGPPGGLGVPLSKAEKRRSINPAMAFNMDSQNSTFTSHDPRMSPLPPSPLRASFNNVNEQALPPREPVQPVREPSREPMRSPSSPSPAGGAGEVFATKQQEHLQKPISPQTSPVTALKTSVSDSDNDATRKAGNGLQPPSIRPMSFSLSDPDFALILNHLDQPRPFDAGSTARATPTRHVGSAPSSPVTVTGPTATNSPVRITQPLNLNGASELVTSTPGPEASPSRLSPSHAGPPLLRARQLSAESTMSTASRFGSDSSLQGIVEQVAAAKQAGKEDVQINLSVLSSVLVEIEEMKESLVSLKGKYTATKRSSQQYSEGLTVAGEEYDKEVARREELEQECIRLRAQLHNQNARLSVISGDEKRQENMRRRSHDLASNLTGLEKDISKLRAQRDITLAEMEELNRHSAASDGLSEEAAGQLSKSLTSRLDTIKEQYREELEPLTAQREALQREIAELRETREQCLEESAALVAKNEELADLNAQLSRQTELLQDTLARARAPTIFGGKSPKSHPSASPSMMSLSTTAGLQDVPEETARVVKVTKPEPIEQVQRARFKWYKASKGPGPEMNVGSASIGKPLAMLQDRRGGMRPQTEVGMRDHHFTQHTTMRLGRCDLCQEKMWGLQEVKCSQCGMVCHAKCAEKLPRSCTGNRGGVLAETVEEPAPPSMFGRELSEQVAADGQLVPVIVTKSITAVESVGMEYEGIYRKTGGSSQSKAITQLFERGDYDSFDLTDVEAFNDISCVTSVLKTYFRQLPDPLLTHKLHESFVAAASIRDANNKHSALCALLKELPKDHYNTLRELMLHLNRVTSQSPVNLMTSQNLGVVFGPTLMRSSDPNREFGDMAGKAISVQWMIENALEVFKEIRI